MEFDLVIQVLCSQSGKKHVQKFMELLAVLPLVVHQIENRSQLKAVNACISESTIAMEIGHFVSDSKEPEGLCSVGCTFIACSVPCLHLSL